MTEENEVPIPPEPLKVAEVNPQQKKGDDLFRFFSPQKNKRQKTGNSWPKGIAWGILGIFLLFIGGFIVSFFVARHEISHSLASHAASLQAGIQDLQNFDPQGAEQEFSSLNGGTNSLKDILGSFSFLFHGGSGAVASLSDLSNQLELFSGELTSLQSGAFGLLGGASSTNLGASVEALRGTVDAVNADTDQLSSASSFMGAMSPMSGTDYISLKAQLEQAKTFLDAFAPWLATSTPHHILILLQNPSEIRPGGGFLGSYADVTIASGTIADVSVHDVADVDEGFTENVVPPQPLQAEIKRFRPADGNWFFDFPTSASETISLFEQSSLYSGIATSTSAPTSSTSFDGVIAVSPKIVSDLLSVTGPITIPLTGSTGSPQAGQAATTFTSDNLLVQIQKLVQDGQAQSATYPKQVLRDLTQGIFGQLASSTDAQQQELSAMALDWVNKKDVMAYFKDPSFENFIASYGADGGVYDLPQNFNGDYLALVDANINGGKSDLYVSSTVEWESQIGTDGTITDDVTIDRKDNANTSPYWWYQVTNQDYLQLFAPDGSSLVNESGGAAKKIVPKLNYTKGGYSTDPLIASIEATDQPIFGYPAVMSHEESGKEVFSTWSTIKSGASTEISFDYTHHAFTPPADGVVYQFIFEKQAGTARSYSFDIDAPLGYQFAENGLPSYQFTSDDPPGRVIINLTLQKI